MLPPPLPPPQQPRIEAVELVFCPRLDIRCRWETANDLAEGMVLIMKPTESFISSSGTVRDLTAVIPGTGQLHVTGHAPQVVIQ